MDEATEEEIYSTQLRQHDREAGLIPKIQKAIQRLASGVDQGGGDSPRGRRRGGSGGRDRGCAGACGY